MKTSFSHGFGRRVSSVFYLVGLLLLVLEFPGGAVSGAAFTTTANGSAVNANLYKEKCDVYINGGPNNGVSALSDGTYWFAVLAPGGQKDPNDGTAKNLSDDFDTTADRTFTVTGNHITSYGGSHLSKSDPSTTTVSDDLLLQLCPYANTTNPGGVYILAICNTGALPVDPRDCKYDAFKVKSSGARRTSDLVAVKTATPTWSRTNAWTIDKTLDDTTINPSAGTATFDYTVNVEKTVTDSEFQVAGDITVFNPNAAPVSGVTVNDSIAGATCTVAAPDGWTGSIEALSSATFTYVCTFASPQTGSGTNTAVVSWDESSIRSPGDSTTATVGFTWPAVPTSVNGPDTITVTDTMNGSTMTLGTTSSSTSFSYQRTVDAPTGGCEAFTNTAVIVETGQSDSVTASLCASEGGFTMGFWRNNNGQARIASADAATLCAYLANFENVLADFEEEGCDTAYVQNYVTEVINAADASGTGQAMFKAQFLASALSAFFDSGLAATEILVDPAIVGTDCITVNNLLEWANSSYGALSGNREVLLTVKDYFDRINNDTAFTC